MIPEDQFEEWGNVLDMDCNVLLYGYGSKINIASLFCEFFGKGYIFISFNGYDSSVTVGDLLKLVLNKIHPNTPISICNIRTIRNALKETNKKLLILIHNIDGFKLRVKGQQKILSSLAAIPNVSIVATIDNISSTLLWDSTDLLKFNWISFNVSTRVPYTTELDFVGV